MSTTSAERMRKFRSINPYYRLWEGAKRRCEDMAHESFKHCGAKGIKFRISQHEVELIFNRDGGHWMKQPSLDRINAEEDYWWGNCRVIEKSINERLPHVPALAREWSD